MSDPELQRLREQLEAAERAAEQPQEDPPDIWQLASSR